MEIAAIDVKAEYLVLGLLEKEKGNPLSVEDISFRLKLNKDIVVQVIHSIQGSYPLCIKKGKYYFPKESLISWLSVIGLIVCVVYTTWGIIQYHNL